MNNLRSNLATYMATLICLLLVLSFGQSTRAAVQSVVSEGGGAASEQVEARNDASRTGGRSVPVPNAGVPANADYYKKGQAHYEAKRYKEAIDAFVQALRVKPDDAETHYDLGLAYYGLSRYKEAADTFERAVRLKPDWDEAHYRLGLVYYVLGKKVPSLEQHKILQKLNPQLAGVLARILKLESSPAGETGAAKNNGAETRQLAVLPAGIVSSAGTVGVRMRPAPVIEDAPTPDATSQTSGERSKSDTSPAGTEARAVEAAAGELSLTDTYRLGVGDVLDIHLLNSKTDASSLYTVMAGGVLEYPLAGVSVVASGMTTDELAARLTVELKRRAISTTPQLSVSVRDYASHTVTLKGLVRNPGLSVLRRETVPLYVVLTEAQPNVEAGRATITRSGQSMSIDLTDQAAMNTLVSPGDVIDVLARAPKFYFIGGQIQQPGQKVFQPSGVTLMQAILTAGGVVRPGSSNVVELSRAGADGRLTTTKYTLKEIKSGKVPDPPLQAGDLIEVVQ